ncbi:hypothetical protein BWK63_09565 [Flavobacterium covae]|uniref:Uncharacterized protein n=1 Tax=Flavobacterium covae TaxID=2906076 RepID=A0ABW8PJ43_9FLAO|nr:MULTISPECIES: hypothetical protein [Flavobacterium]OWP80704.1 hypothetical protein BWK63_09565 [Flavobacterium covae]POR21303.1 hypothetical protein BWK57_10505 [Flavobacterium columnare]
MSLEAELARSMRQLKQRDVDTFPCEVVSVDKTKGTCTVSDETLQYTDVRLTAIIEENVKAFFLYPKVGSQVLVSPINEDLTKLYVEAYAEIESMEVSVEDVKFQMDSSGFLLQKENETLKALIVDLIEAIENQSYTVSTTGSATAQTGSTTLLNNKADFTSIKERFKQFLKGI